MDRTTSRARPGHDREPVGPHARTGLRRLGGLLAERDPLPAALVALTVVTGLLDAISYLGLGKVFLAMMTGNVIFLGLAAGGTAGMSAPGTLIALGCFATGIVVATHTERVAVQRARQHWFFHAMSVEVLLLAGASAIAWLSPSGEVGARYGIIALLALAMGARCATVRRLAVPDLPVTVGLTGALIALVQDSPLAGGRNHRAARRLGVVVAMAVGAVIGAVLMGHFGLRWSLLAVLLLVFVITLAVRAHPAGPAVEPGTRTRARRSGDAPVARDGARKHDPACAARPARLRHGPLQRPGADAPAR